MTTILLLLLIGVFSGIISGMGIGGGTILIPALSIFFDYEQKTAQNINLLYFIPTAIIALTTHTKNNNIEKKIIWKIIFFGLLGAAFGSFLATGLNNTILRKLFGIFLLLMGTSEIFKKTQKNTREEAFKMNMIDFETLKSKFSNADVEEKIDLYVSTPNLTNEQYKLLLRLFPMEQIGKLEKALDKIS